MELLKLFYCPACKEPIANPRTGVCYRCIDRLLPATALCPTCRIPSCRELPCIAPWRAAKIERLFALYFATSSCLAVLRHWKKTRSLDIEKLILRADLHQPRLQEVIDWQPNEVLPIPQAYARSIQLSHHPAQSLADWLIDSTQCLRKKGASPFIRRFWNTRRPQASRLGHDREKVEVADWDPNLARRYRDKRVLLVDDFYTSGSTLEAYASLLLDHWHVQAVSGFVLGMRPSRVEIEAKIG